MWHKLLTGLWVLSFTSVLMADTDEPIELQLLAEYPVEGMAAGNLSGLARCGDQLLTVSDREDDRIQRLETQGAVWHAVPMPFELPSPPETHLPWGMRAQVMLSTPIRGGAMDFEGISCDATGTRYLVSEAYAAVLQLMPNGTAHWLTLPDALLPQARARGLLHKYNALYEGIAVTADGSQLWLAAEREQRGLIKLLHQQGQWQCPSRGCVVFYDMQAAVPTATAEALPAQDFSDLVIFQGKLFTLERQARRFCRRSSESGEVERCWSFAATAQKEHYRYPTPYGVAEALWLEGDSVLIGLDNNNWARADGEVRPIIWRFAAPAEGWMAP